MYWSWPQDRKKRGSQDSCPSKHIGDGSTFSQPLLAKSGHNSRKQFKNSYFYDREMKINQSELKICSPVSEEKKPVSGDEVEVVSANILGIRWFRGLEKSGKCWCGIRIIFKNLQLHTRRYSSRLLNVDDSTLVYSAKWRPVFIVYCHTGTGMSTTPKTDTGVVTADNQWQKLW